jgi:beta-lactamase superfamily II metal-dependent hydrolase
MNALEIDFLPVGENSKSGDAIALRFGTYESAVWKQQTVFIIDGGNADSGEALIKHVTEIYKTDTVDRVILTHPDGDHACGLRNVVQELKVGKIWMHRPWHYWTDLKDSVTDDRITKNSFGERLRAAYQYAYDIEQIANKRKIEIFHPHQGCSYQVNQEDILTILGPGKEFYLSLIQSSDKTPHMGLESFSKSLTISEKISEYEDLSFETEHLNEDGGETSSENDMSLVLYLNVANSRILFTGDAGTMGLYKAISYAVEHKIDLKNLNLFQVPHHGSRHNLSKGILQYIFAPQAIISCAKNGEPSHPSKIVANSLHRRNIMPYCTKGELLNYHSGSVPTRPGLGPVNPYPFSSVVEIPVEA